MSIGSRITWPTALVLPGLDEIPPAELLGRQVDRGGHAVHVALEGEEALRRAEAAERAVWRSVRRHSPPPQPNVRAVVRTSRVNRPPREHHGRQRAVRTAVDDEVDVHREQTAVARHGGPMASSGRVPLGRRDHVFGAVVDELHGAAGLPRQQRGVAGDHRGYSSLPPKPPPVSICTTRTLLARQREQRHQCAVHVVGTLQRAPHRHALVRAGDRDHSVRLDVQLLLRAGFVLTFDNELRVVPDGVHVAVFDLVALEDVVGTPDHLARRRAPHLS